MLITLLDGAGNPVLDHQGQSQAGRDRSERLLPVRRLQPGEYVVQIEATNFQQGGPLHDGQSSNGQFEDQIRTRTVISTTTALMTRIRPAMASVRTR